MAGVLPDTKGPDKVFDYSVPPDLAAHVVVGSRVRVRLAGRRVAGWVVRLGHQPHTDLSLSPVLGLSGLGPAPDLIDLAAWAAWRWAGRRAAFLGTASPERVVRGLPAAPGPAGPYRLGEQGPEAVATTQALDDGGGVLRIPPAGDVFAVVAAAVAWAGADRGDALVVVPGVSEARFIEAQLRRRGLPVAAMPRDWAMAAAGSCTVVGTRTAAWAPWPRPGALVVLGESDERLRSERVPTWHAREVAVERAQRAGVPCLLVDACPSLEALAGVPPARLPRTVERQGWALLEVVDRRQDEPGLGLFSHRLVDLARRAEPGRRVVCVLNRKGRARLVVCAECGSVASCGACGTGMRQAPLGQGLECPTCEASRPSICHSCGRTRLKGLRPGVARAAEELELLCGKEVLEVTSETPTDGDRSGAAVMVGTEAVLHRLAGAEVVAFLDFDSELLAPRFRAGEHALRLLARASRLVGERGGGGRVVVQTRVGDHEVLDAARHGDPDRFTSVELARRVDLSLPPVTALALVSGAGAARLIERLPPGGEEPGVEVSRAEAKGSDTGRWLLRAPNVAVLCDSLAAAGRGSGRLRVEVDPERL